jgi:hypothetical protein
MDTMETEKAKRISLFLSAEQEELVRTLALNSIQRRGIDVGAFQDLKTGNLLVAFFETLQVPKRYVRPKNARGQGRKKKNNNINIESEQDVFRVNPNSLAPYVGVNSDAE